MAREFSAGISATVGRRANRKYFAAVEIRLPPSPGDLMPPIIRAAQGEFDAPSFLTYEQFTYESFRGTLGRNPNVGEQAVWVAALSAAYAGGQAALREQARVLIRGIFEGAEYGALATTDAAFISAMYTGYLGRTAEVGGKSFWLDVLHSTNRAHILDSFEGSAEFGRRASEINGLIHFEPTIRSIGAISMPDGNAADNVDLTIDNLDDSYSAFLGDEQRVLYPARTLVCRAYPVGDDGYELDVKITGFTTFNDIVKKTASLTVVSDINRQGYSVGHVDTQRCPKLYKGPGCDTNDHTPTCSRIWGDAVNGCASKDPAPMLEAGTPDNRPSFGGGPDKAVEAAGAVESPEGPTTPEEPWRPGYTDPEDPRLNPINRRGPATRLPLDIY